MALSFLYLAFARILQCCALSRRDSGDLTIEIVMLRPEVGILRRQVARPALRPSDRALLAGLRRLLPRTNLRRFFVQPETLLRWHRELVRRKWTYPEPPGRPGIPAGTVQVVIRLAGRTRHWAIGESTASWRRWVSTWRPPASGTSSSVTTSTPPGTEEVRRGASS